jgi:hypothetical protein
MGLRHRAAILETHVAGNAQAHLRKTVQVLLPWTRQGPQGPCPVHLRNLRRLMSSS